MDGRTARIQALVQLLKSILVVWMADCGFQLDQALPTDCCRQWQAAITAQHPVLSKEQVRVRHRNKAFLQRAHLSFSSFSASVNSTTSGCAGFESLAYWRLRFAGFLTRFRPPRCLLRLGCSIESSPAVVPPSGATSALFLEVCA